MTFIVLCHTPASAERLRRAFIQTIVAGSSNDVIEFNHNFTDVRTKYGIYRFLAERTEIFKPPGSQLIIYHESSFMLALLNYDPKKDMDFHKQIEEFFSNR